MVDTTGETETTTETELPADPAEWTEAQKAALQEQLDAIVAKTGPVAQDVERAPLYNHKNRLFAHPVTGEIVELQGSPEATDLYVQKGFHVLSREEVRQWRTIKPLVVSEQRERARIITNLRRWERDDPTHTLKLNEDQHPLEDYPTAELRDVEAEWREITGGKVVSLSGPKAETVAAAARRRMTEAAEARERSLSRGVEVGGGEALLAKKSRPGAGGPVQAAG